VIVARVAPAVRHRLALPSPASPLASRAPSSAPIVSYLITYL
jgi:hypothetical protein